MLLLDDIKVRFECQGYKATQFSVSHENYKSVLFFESTIKTKIYRVRYAATLYTYTIIIKLTLLICRFCTDMQTGLSFSGKDTNVKNADIHL